MWCETNQTAGVILFIMVYRNFSGLEIFLIWFSQTIREISLLSCWSTHFFYKLCPENVSAIPAKMVCLDNVEAYKIGFGNIMGSAITFLHRGGLSVPSWGIHLFTKANGISRMVLFDEVEKNLLAGYCMIIIAKNICNITNIIINN